MVALRVVPWCLPLLGIALDTGSWHESLCHEFQGVGPCGKGRGQWGRGRVLSPAPQGSKEDLGGLCPHLSNPRVGPGDIKKHRTLQPRRCFCSRSRNTCCWSLAPRGHSTGHRDESVKEGGGPRGGQAGRSPGPCPRRNEKGWRRECCPWRQGPEVGGGGGGYLAERTARTKALRWRGRGSG